MYKVNDKDFGSDFREAAIHCDTLKKDKKPYTFFYDGMKMDEYNPTGFALEVNAPKDMKLHHVSLGPLFNVEIPAGIWFFTENGITKNFEEAKKYETYQDANFLKEDIENIFLGVRIYLSIVTEYK